MFEKLLNLFLIKKEYGTLQFDIKLNFYKYVLIILIL